MSGRELGGIVLDNEENGRHTMMFASGFAAADTGQIPTPTCSLQRASTLCSDTNWGELPGGSFIHAASSLVGKCAKMEIPVYKPSKELIP